MYHRIAEPAKDPWGLAVSPKNFAEQLEVIVRRRTALPMSGFVSRLAGGTLPDDALAVTFDDGYADNLENAKPALARAGVPATLFLATGYTVGGARFWWDELARLILDRDDPVDAELRTGATSVRLSFGAPEEEDRARSTWRASEPPRTARQAAYLESWRRIQRLAPAERDRAMGEARRVLGEAQSGDPARPMTADEVRSLVSGALIALGGHTVSHPALPGLSLEEQCREIALGKDEAEAIAGRPVSGFAFPYGAASRETRAAVGVCGFDWACSTEPRAVRPGHDDLFALPRLAVADCDGERFAEMLAPA